jgi:hypothetical protein
MLEPDQKPTKPLPERPNGYMTLENASSLKRFWDVLRGFKTRGYALEIPSRTAPDVCRRAILGVRNEGAGGLLDTTAIIKALQDDDTMTLESFNLAPEVREAVSALIHGDKTPMAGILSAAYTLEFELILAFTARRELVLKADAKFWPKLETTAPFPLDWPLRAIRMGRGEYRMMVERLSGVPSGR